MARLTTEQRAALEQQLADDDAAAQDDDDEYELGFSDGSYVRGRHSRVSRVAAARGVKIEPDPDPPADDGKGGKAAPKGQAQQGARAFGRRVS